VLDRGGVLSIAGIHLSDIPVLNYQEHLFFERELLSVTANTRADGRELLSEGAAAKIRPHVEFFGLAEANQALIRLKSDGIEGTGVLVMSR